jgi:acyl-CoA thioesterase I
MSQKQLKILWIIMAAILIVSLILATAPHAQENSSPKIRVACIGDSNTEWSSYPDILQRLISNGSRVRNFGAFGTGVLLTEGRPYFYEQAFQDAKAFQPTVAVIMLGTNDAHENLTATLGNFAADYKALISQVQTMQNRPCVFLVTPPPVYPNSMGIDSSILQTQIIPQIHKVARELNLPLIDINTALTDHPEFFIDGVHINSQGSQTVANEVYRALQSAGQTRV